MPNKKRKLIINIPTGHSAEYIFEDNNSLEDSSPGYDTVNAVSVPTPSKTNSTEQPKKSFEIAAPMQPPGSTTNAIATRPAAKTIPHYSKVMKNKKTGEAGYNKLVYVSEPVHPPTSTTTTQLPLFLGEEPQVDAYSALNSDHSNSIARPESTLSYLSPPPPLPPAFDVAHLVTLEDFTRGTVASHGGAITTTTNTAALDEVVYYNDLAVLRAQRGTKPRDKQRHSK